MKKTILALVLATISNAATAQAEAKGYDLSHFTEAEKEWCTVTVPRSAIKFYREKSQIPPDEMEGISVVLRTASTRNCFQAIEDYQNGLPQITKEALHSKVNEIKGFIDKKDAEKALETLLEYDMMLTRYGAWELAATNYLNEKVAN